MSLKLPIQLQVIIDKIQSYLNYESIGKRNTSFAQNGIGKVGTTAFLLGLIGGIHLGFLSLGLIIYYFIIDTNQWNNIIIPILQWCTYITFLSFFHFLEFFTTAYCQPSNVNYDSFVVNHSKDYTIAAIASWIEFWIETLLFGKYKRSFFIMFIGYIMLLGGQIIRSIAMYSCGSNFSHTIMEERDEEHKLVTQGIYSILRHPSYFGWFYWSIGTQVFLCNPICTVLYTFASWTFFSNRIPYEESLLLKFYKHQYDDYMKQTIIGIPFISSRRK